NVDPGAEQEVDLGGYWSAIVAHWWLPVLGLVAGVFVGYLISLGGKEVWKASATVYLGASYSPVGGVFLQGPQANPSTAGTIARAKVLTRAAAVKTTARSRRNSVVVAAFLGFVLGLIAALVWEPLTRRSRPAS